MTPRVCCSRRILLLPKSEIFETQCTLLMGITVIIIIICLLISWQNPASNRTKKMKHPLGNSPLISVKVQHTLNKIIIGKMTSSHWKRIVMVASSKLLVLTGSRLWRQKLSALKCWRLAVRAIYLRWFCESTTRSCLKQKPHVFVDIIAVHLTTVKRRTLAE